MSSRTAGVIPDEGPLLHRTVPGDVLFCVLRTQRLVFEGIDRRFREVAGLSLALWEVLVVLGTAPDNRLRMGDITRRMLVSKSNVTKLIDRLEQAGMITREGSVEDRRLVYATLTRKGVDALKRGGEIFNEGAREYFGRHLTTAEMRNLVSGLSKVIVATAPEGLQVST